LTWISIIISKMKREEQMVEQEALLDAKRKDAKPNSIAELDELLHTMRKSEVQYAVSYAGTDPRDLSSMADVSSSAEYLAFRLPSSAGINIPAPPPRLRQGPQTTTSFR
jgi:hypothetical protein